MASLIVLAWNAVGWVGDRTNWPPILDWLDDKLGDAYYALTGMEG